ncbi:arylsulfotransferase family protein [Salinirubellus salinus]|uniref:Arylsulfotransferase family protein n=1 Tax=Salinirubellus salinus TaxID=1364945 RepID=A0A9E7U4J1_9EURY|nr:arylsulfotransferase family protein [Salinirubellus salinus]UWM54375.1 arylsulfotransferase family protein [Salinirubellus salinus]
MTAATSSPVPTRTFVRGLFAVLVVVSAGFLVVANSSAAVADPYAELRAQAALPPEERTPVAPPADGTTVVTSHQDGDLFVLAPDGTVTFHTGRHDGYWDVDPVPGGDRTLLYAATDKLDSSDAACEPVEPDGHCARQLVERVDLTTGEVTVLYSRIDPRYRASEWHDVDRLDDDHVVIADMYRNAVTVVNVTSDTVSWAWNLQSYAPLSSGGPFPDDWAHLNDVEVLDDGRIVVSLRNHDQVVFLDPPEGVQDEWTLGADGDHSILYEQHNPDYIPRENGGPALLVADSERNLVVEYQRQDGRWNQSWAWTDSTLQWPRDADRLPNGHTLVTDTHGGRVVEVDREGRVTWTFDLPRPYEAERLETGDESAGGPSAVEAGLRSSTDLDGAGSSADARSTSLLEQAKIGLKGLVPTKVANGITSVAPVWMGVFDLLAVLVGVLAAVCWGAAESWWAGYRLRSPVGRRS